jgi:hypothetical protein
MARRAGRFLQEFDISLGRFKKTNDFDEHCQALLSKEPLIKMIQGLILVQ